MSAESLARLLRNNFELLLTQEQSNGVTTIKAKLIFVEDSGRWTTRETVLEADTTL